MLLEEISNFSAVYRAMKRLYQLFLPLQPALNLYLGGIRI
jgi:hypothetical protein